MVIHRKGGPLERGLFPEQTMTVEMPYRPSSHSRFTYADEARVGISLMSRETSGVVL